jgi:23S rRNA (pseudouridine1915-N3)-methyltransferase
VLGGEIVKLKIKQLEGELLIKASANANLIIAFDEHGKQHSTTTTSAKSINIQCPVSAPSIPTTFIPKRLASILILLAIPRTCCVDRPVDWIQTGITHYQKQLPSELNFTLTTPEAQKRKGKNIEQIKQLEGELLIKASANANLIIAFDEHGKQHSTQEIAKALKNWQQNGDSVALLIGGTDGLSNAIKQQAHQLWGLSNLTLPHSR